ncbi:MAG: hypothetical protein GF383_14730 [Candidatus Lokiarchaeota archaeon]|nr:hypothetical protein [Candidatus Lokiarchaeota archaeon]MBD3342671.1 hypothetical protein [Candidatus Lokiarchaeota archaeon]
MHLVLTFFHRFKGPEIIFSYPLGLESEIENKIIRFFDLDLDETFFEIILINQQQRIINLYFEIYSKWARGNVEMLMLSMIVNQKFEHFNEQMYDFLRTAKKMIVETEDIYKAFYKNDDFYDKDMEIDIYYEILKKILVESIDGLIKVI